ncbi:hypothetical protein TMEN_5675 [Trichophyton mentagrophytes]|nr:hypothetical protein TMEN_5675 [Trichophyton mentagrophytes]
MLRRKPTAITVTSEDIIAFEEAQLRRQQELKNKSSNKAGSSGNKAENDGARDRDGDSMSSSNRAGVDPNDELKPLPGDKARIVRTRDERIGVGRSWAEVSMMDSLF